MDSFPVEDIYDDIYGVIHRNIPRMGGAFARSFMNLMEYDTANFFSVLGFASGTVAGSFDNLSLFNTAHPISINPGSGTYSNRPSVDADLSISTVQAASIALDKQLAPDGLTFLRNGIRCVVINPANKYIAQQVINYRWQPYSPNLTENPISNEGIKIISWPYFELSGNTGTDNGYFFVGHEHYLNFIMRQRYESDTDFDISSRSQIIAAHVRFDEGASDARGTYGSTGS